MTFCTFPEPKQVNLYSYINEAPPQTTTTPKPELPKLPFTSYFTLVKAIPQGFKLFTYSLNRNRDGEVKLKKCHKFDDLDVNETLEGKTLTYLEGRNQFIICGGKDKGTNR